MQSDVFLADCPARTTLEVIGGTWTMVVIVALDEQPYRYGELLRRIGGISPKMLTQTLARLEQRALVERTTRAGRPAYRLTALGGSLVGPVRELVRWAEAHTEDLVAGE